MVFYLCEITRFVTHQAPDEAGHVKEEGLDEQEKRHPLVIGDFSEFPLRNVLGDIFIHRYKVCVFRHESEVK